MVLQEEEDGLEAKGKKKKGSSRRVSWLKEGKVAPEEESGGSSESEVKAVFFSSNMTDLRHPEGGAADDTRATVVFSCRVFCYLGIHWNSCLASVTVSLPCSLEKHARVDNYFSVCPWPDSLVIDAYSTGPL